MKKLQLYADGVAPNKGLIESLIRQGITGCTINPSLAKLQLPMSYETYSKFLIDAFSPYPVSVQVLAPDTATMYEQALKIASWGENVYVKIPVITVSGEPTAPLIIDLLDKGIKVNVTAIFTDLQVLDLEKAGLRAEHDCVLSIFCGRIADTGRVPHQTVEHIRNFLDRRKGGRGNNKILWAGVRSMMDVNDADAGGCDIITLPQAILDKLPMAGKDLNEYCLETVAMFDRDSKNFTI